MSPDTLDTPSLVYEDLLTRAAAAAEPASAATPAERARWLEAAADALDAAAGDLVPVAASETHLPEGRLTGELKRTTFQLRLFADVLREGSYLDARVDHADPGWGMGPRPDLRRVLRPLGPVAVWSAGNFPFAFSVAGGDTASALAAGCPVVVTAHPGHPLLSDRTAAVLASALDKAGAPDGIVGLVTGVETGRRLVADPRIRAGAFTGSQTAGRALFDLAAARPDPIPFYGELGSVNPVFVTPGAARERADALVSGFLGSVTLGVGQFCTKPGVIFVPAGTDLVERIAQGAGTLTGAPMLNDRIRSGFAAALARLAEQPEVTLVAGTTDVGTAPALALFTTTYDQHAPARERLEVECFGPAALIVTYDDPAQLADAAAALDGQLTATVQGTESEAELVRPLLERLADRAGRVVWNGWPTGVSVTHAMHHGGPYPAATTPTTSVGTAAIGRFLRPVSYQSVPDGLLPPALQEANPWNLPRRVDGALRLP
ncbi:aldehyde dehydrogenase (NADP(+)) [Antribacter gilvus]|uniref:aldehyde dehydrogenase (NADP(+)) n=1 Tax=Antribacter gilvus TaxID=2304675 RepID=UPI000F785C7B|nr:aldehyde dehydrogenase (NADP(+)) [Antribacter gilvus]